VDTDQDGKDRLRVDSTKRFKVAAVLFALCVRALPALGIVFGLFDGTETEWVLAFAGANIFVFAMTYFHWPYELHIDLQYNGAAISAQSLMVDQLTDEADFDASTERHFTIRIPEGRTTMTVFSEGAACGASFVRT
jgi:hypothetical protein